LSRNSSSGNADNVTNESLAFDIITSNAHSVYLFAESRFLMLTVGTWEVCYMSQHCNVCVLCSGLNSLAVVGCL